MNPKRTIKFIPLEIILRRPVAWVTTWGNSRGDLNTPWKFLTGFIIPTILFIVFSSFFAFDFNKAQADITTGLVGHWEFDEGAGTTTGDSSGNGNTGTLTNGPTWTTGKIGGALSFDGVNDYVKGNAYSSSLNLLGTSFTLTAWVKPTSQTISIIVDKPFADGAHNSPYFDWSLVYNANGDGKVSVFMACQVSHAYNNTALTVNAWNHITVTYNGSNLNYYLNGNADGIPAQTCSITNTNSSPVRIGANGAGVENFPGHIDEVRIYNRALTQAEITELYNYTGAGGTPPPSDTTLPVLSSGSPTGALTSGTTQTTLSLTTNENATCKYGTTANTAYASIANTFTTIGGTSHSQTITGLTNGASYNYYVKCQDASNNANTTDYTISFSVSAPAGDTTPPTVSITSPISGTTVSGTITVSANAFDNIGVAGVQFKLDTNTNLGTEDTTSPYSYSLNTTTITDAPHTLIAVARDTSNNYATSSVITITVNNASPPPPDIQAPSIPTGLAATAVSSSQINLSWTASIDNVGVTGYKIFRCQGTGCAPTVQIATSATNSYSNTGLTASTAYTYAVSSYDAAGNELVLSISASATTQTQTGKTYYISPAGNDANTCTQAQTITTLKQTISSVKGCLTAGSTLILRNGTYSGVSNDFTGLPSGSAAEGYITIKAENDGEAIITSTFDLGNGGTGLTSYVQFEGLHFEQAGQKTITGNHIKIKRTGFKGGSPVGNLVNVVVGAASDVLIEDSWSYGAGGRYNFLIFNADRVVLRRVVARHDGGWNDQGSLNPEIGIVFYNSSNSWCLNCIVLDSDLTTYSTWYGPYAILRNASANPDHLVTNNGNIGSIALNNRNSGFVLETTQSTSITNFILTDFIAIDHSNYGISIADWQPGSVIDAAIDRVTLLQKNQTSSLGGVICGTGSGVKTFKNIIIANFAGGADLSGCSATYFNTYNNGGTSTGAGRHIYNPETNGLRYPPRIESGFNLKINGESGGQIGAQIVNKIGASDALLGDAGWNTDTGSTLWPWPNETRIKNEMCSGVTRGWCGTSKTLTSYIWEYLGNPIPPEIYGSVLPDTTPPSIPTTLTPTPVSSSQINLSWSASTDDVGVTGYKIYRCAGLTCAPTAQIATSTTNSYSNTGLTASTAYTYAVSSYDAAGNESAKSSPVSATTQAPADTAPPAISAISSSSITQTSSTINWATDEMSTHQVEYGLTSSYGSTTALNSTLMTSHSQALTGLSANTLYHYRVRSKDAASNEAISTNQTFTTLANPTPDTTPPSQTTNLSATNISQTALTLNWTAPGDDGNTGQATGYDLRYFTSSITESNWNTATKLSGLPNPSQSGTNQEFYVTVGLLPNTTYYFALKTKDEVPNWSEISNIIKITTLPETQTPTIDNTPPVTGGGGGGLFIDTTPPSSPQTFKANSADKQINLNWQNPKDTDFVRVLILATTKPIEANSSKETLIQQGARTVYEGDKIEFTDTNLDNNQTYYYAIYSYDRKPNYSSPTIIQAKPEANKISIPVEKEKQEETITSFPYPDGTLLKTEDDDKIYYIVNNRKRWITNPEIFLSYNFTPNSQITVTKEVLDQYPEEKEITKLSHREGTLVRAKNDFKVYIIKPPFKRHIFNPAIFNMYKHFSWNDIKEIDQDTLNSYITSDLYRAINDPKVFSLEEIDETQGKAFKHHLNFTPEQFTDKNYKWEQVFIVNQEERDYYETGEEVQ